MFLYFVAALAAGTFIDVLCESGETYKTWSSISKLFRSSQNFSVKKVNQSEINQAIKDSELHFLIVEGDQTTISTVLKNVYDEKYAEHHMKVILTELGAPDMNHFDKFVEPFIQVRSFAINTMRHGAPLELEL